LRRVGFSFNSLIFLANSYFAAFSKSGSFLQFYAYLVRK